MLRLLHTTAFVVRQRGSGSVARICLFDCNYLALATSRATKIENHGLSERNAAGMKSRKPWAPRQARPERIYCSPSLSRKKGTE